MVWEVKKLGDICDSIFSGGDVPKDRLSKFKTDKYSVPIYANGEKHKGLYGYTDIARVNTPSMTVSARGTIGYSEIRYEPFFPVVRLIVLTPNIELVNLEFLKYILSSMEFINSGTSIPQLTVPMIKDYECNVPSLPEQKRIVSILDSVFADLEQARVKTEQNLKNARELFDSYLQQVFSQKGEGWEDKRLDDICTFSSGGTPSKQNDNFWNGDIPWVSGRDMKSTQLSDTFLHISQRAIDEGSSRIAPKGTLLTLVRGMGLAHGAQVTELMVPSAFNQDIKGIHLKANIVPRYLVFVLRKKINSSADIISSAAHGTLKINMDALRNIVVPVPPKKEQKYIVDRLNAFIESVDNLQFIYQEKLNAIDELKKSILQKAFSGELTNTAE